jgi:hypothetical protein
MATTQPAPNEGQSQTLPQSQVSPEALRVARESIVQAEVREKLGALKIAVSPEPAKEVSREADDSLKKVLDGTRNFTLKDADGFYRTAAADFEGKDGYKKLDSSKQAAARTVFLDELFDSFHRSVIANCPAILADGVDNDIQLEVTIEDGVVVEAGGVKVVDASRAKYDAAVARLDTLAKEAVMKGAGDSGYKTLDQFMNDHAAGGTLMLLMYGQEKLEEAFTNPNKHPMLSLLLGAMGYGIGARAYGKLLENKQASGFMDSIFGTLADLTKGTLDFRSINEMKDSADFEKLLQPRTVLRKRFKANVALNLTAPVRIASIAFTEDCSLNTRDSEKNFAKETEYKDVVLMADQQIPAGAAFRDVAVMVAENQENQPAVAMAPEAAAPAVAGAPGSASAK